jgi:hypothetical protein
MSDYERSTVLPTRAVFERADEIFAERAELARTTDSRHSVTWTGAEGTVTLDAHRHGPSTIVVARTDRLRTSKLDTVVRHLFNQLPYQHGDPPRE